MGLTTFRAPIPTFPGEPKSKSRSKIDSMRETLELLASVSALLCGGVIEHVGARSHLDIKHTVAISKLDTCSREA